jgi:hypothetical protein
LKAKCDTSIVTSYKVRVYVVFYCVGTDNSQGSVMTIFYIILEESIDPVLLKDPLIG